MNAMDGCKALELDADGLDAEWGKAKKAKKLVKFGGGFYCGHSPSQSRGPAMTRSLRPRRVKLGLRLRSSASTPSCVQVTDTALRQLRGNSSCGTHGVDEHRRRRRRKTAQFRGPRGPSTTWAAVLAAKKSPGGGESGCNMLLSQYCRLVRV